MKTKELIRFLIEKDFINYCDDYKIIDEVIKRLEEYDELKKGGMFYKDLNNTVVRLIKKHTY